jgi:hypothetical protein
MSVSRADHPTAHLHVLQRSQEGAGRIVNEFLDGDICRWSSLIAGALVGSLPLVVLCAFL